MRINFIQMKIINLGMIFLILVSCSSTNKIKNDNVVEDCLKDYIKSYNRDFSKQELKGVQINFDSENIILSDTPEIYILGGVNELQSNRDYIIGTYRGILVKAYSRNIKFLQEIDSRIVSKADELNFVDNNGKAVKLDMNLLDWNPTLIITYKPKEGVKEIQIVGNKELEIQDF